MTIDQEVNLYQTFGIWECILIVLFVKLLEKGLLKCLKHQR